MSDQKLNSHKMQKGKKNATSKKAFTTYSILKTLYKKKKIISYKRLNTSRVPNILKFTSSYLNKNDVCSLSMSSPNQPAQRRVILGYSCNGQKRRRRLDRACKICKLHLETESIVCYREKIRQPQQNKLFTITQGEILESYCINQLHLEPYCQ